MTTALKVQEAAAPADDHGAEQDGPAFTGAALWGVGALLAVANFVAVLDLTISNVSAPTIAGSLGASVSQGAWVITSYAVAEAITVPLTGWLAARFGAERVFAAALGAFAFASLMCGLSPSLGVLVSWRVIQGFCGAPLMPLSQALILRLFPARQQSAAMGLWSVTTLVAPVCGPILGGLLCDSLGWPSIFLINVPIAATAGLIAWRKLVRGPHLAAAAPFDGVGLFLLVTWVGLLQVMLDLGKDRDWFSSPLIDGLAVTSAIAFAAFLIWELTAQHPIVDLRVLRHRGFTAGLAVLACALAGFFATNVLTPLWLETNLGYTPTQAGLATGATGILAVAAAPVVAWLSNRCDLRLLASAGVGWLMATSLLRGLATTDMSFWNVYEALFLVGAAMESMVSGRKKVGMAAVEPEETANASGLSSFVRTIASAFATSVVTTRWETYAAASHADLASRSIHLNEALGGLSGAGLTPQQGLEVLNRMVDSQALILATNRLFWDIAALFALGLVLVWTIPRPQRAIDATVAH